MISINDLPATSPNTKLRAKVGTRVITSQFDVLDDIIREVINENGNGVRSFRPTSATVQINISSGAFAVDLLGPAYNKRHPHDTGYASFSGDHYMDCDLLGNQLVTDLVVAALKQHELAG